MFEITWHVGTLALVAQGQTPSKYRICMSHGLEVSGSKLDLDSVRLYPTSISPILMEKSIKDIRYSSPSIRKLMVSQQLRLMTIRSSLNELITPIVSSHYVGSLMLKNCSYP